MAAPFPTTPILDTFNRANNASIGSDWLGVVETGDSDPAIFSNAISGTGSGAFSTATWRRGVFLNCEAYHDIPATATSADTTAIYLRVMDQNSAAARGYIVVNQASGMTVYRWYNNAYTNLANLGIQMGAGTKVGASCVTSGTDIIITAYVDDGLGGGWTIESPVTDTGAVTAFPLLALRGYIGFQVLGSGTSSVTKQIDNFGGGDIPASVTELPVYKLRYPRPAMREEQLTKLLPRDG